MKPIITTRPDVITLFIISFLPKSEALNGTKTKNKIEPNVPIIISIRRGNKFFFQIKRNWNVISKIKFRKAKLLKGLISDKK